MNAIVVGYDGSQGAERALARAADIAEAFSAPLAVVCVETASVPTPMSEPVGPVLIPGGASGPVPAVPFPGGQAPERGPQQPEEVARRHLEHARTALAGRKVQAEYVAEVGDAADRLLDVAEQHDADLIVVGSREHGFLDRLLGSTVDETLARRAGRDVMLVH